MTAEWLQAVVAAVQQQTASIRVLDLARPDGSPLPSFEAGAHIAVRCGTLIRHYSLFGTEVDPTSYRIAVKRETPGRGGSAWIFENLAKVGDRCEISAPRNNFPLALCRPAYRFIAGGIGATPIFSMLFRLAEEGVRARFVYLCRSRAELAFREELERIGRNHDVVVHFDDEAGGPYDILAELAGCEPTAEVYCCGPAPLMRAVESWGKVQGATDRLHFEYFTADPALSDIASTKTFAVVTARSHKRVLVGQDESILHALRREGVFIDSECEEGICGTCRTGVLAGIPLHRDSYLTAAERRSNSSIVTCVSRALSEELVLDV